MDQTAQVVTSTEQRTAVPVVPYYYSCRAVRGGKEEWAAGSTVVGAVMLPQTEMLHVPVNALPGKAASELPMSPETQLALVAVECGDWYIACCVFVESNSNTR